MDRERGSFECALCSRVYKKAEHLIRHERSHTGSKPYTCQHCNRKFSRQDSLARHVKIHKRKAHPTPESPATSLHTATPGVNVFPPASESSDVGSSSLYRTDPFLMEQTSQSLLENSSNHDVVGNLVAEEPHLNWPGSDDLLQLLMSSDLSTWQMPPEFLPMPYGLQQPRILPPEEDTDNHLGGTSDNAVRNLSLMITAQSASVAEEVASTDITSGFLDGCLHMFFSQFIPTFPVLHRATFVFKECSHPLLLNAIAIGSLFLGAEGASTKGEALWRLAHTAVATSWQTMMRHRGPHDQCDGIQLVLTALLGQVYAMLSKNSSLRITGRIFHSLGFSWSRYCGIYNFKAFSANEIPSLDASPSTKSRQWRLWAARELQLRALLGHYILDGQIVEFSGSPFCVRHAANSLTLPSNDNIFTANNADEWIIQMQSYNQTENTFREVICSLFTHNIAERQLTSLSFRLILEALKSFVSDSHESGGAVVGTPSTYEILRALGKIYIDINHAQILSNTNKLELLLRWHVIGIDAAVDSNWLLNTLFARLGIEQDIFGGFRILKPEFDLKSWVSTVQAHRAILHAAAIYEITQQLPFGQCPAIHLPTSLFIAATVLCAFTLAEAITVVLPDFVDWEDVMFAGSLGLIEDTLTRTEKSESESRAFLRGVYQQTTSSRIRNTLYDMNLLQASLRRLSELWGVCSEMEVIVGQYISRCT